MYARVAFHVVVAALPGLGLFCGCAAPSPNALPKYQAPPAGAPAAIIDVGNHGHAWSVDGAETPSFAKTLRLVPGEHRVGINCLSFEILEMGILPGGPRAPATPMVTVESELQFVLVTGSFAVGRTYYARCVATNGVPRAWLADAPDGSDLPQGFTLICTRNCPTLFTLAVPAVHASDENARPLPLLHSFYQDDESCSEHVGEATKQVTWNGRTWYLTAPESLVSPSSETKRNGTPLDIRPLNDFVSQAQKLGAIIVNGDRAIAADTPVGLRLVMVVHEFVAEGPGKFSLQTIIAVRLCGSTERFSGSALYIGPPKGVNLTEWWRSRKSQRWIDGYREAFSLSVADALEWAAAKASTLSAIERLHSGSIPQVVRVTNRCSGRPAAAAD